MGKTGMGSRPLRSRDPIPEKKAAGLRPAPRWGRKAPDPISWPIAHQTRHNLGSYGESISYQPATVTPPPTPRPAGRAKPHPHHAPARHPWQWQALTRYDQKQLAAIHRDE